MCCSLVECLLSLGCCDMLLLSNEQVERDFSNFNFSLTSGGFSLPHKLTSPLSVPVTPYAIFLPSNDKTNCLPSPAFFSAVSNV